MSKDNKQDKEFAILSDRELARRGQRVATMGMIVLVVVAALAVGVTGYANMPTATAGGGGPIQISAPEVAVTPKAGGGDTGGSTGGTTGAGGTGVSSETTHFKPTFIKGDKKPKDPKPSGGTSSGTSPLPEGQKFDW